MTPPEPRPPRWALVTCHQGDPAEALLGVLADGVVRRPPPQLAGLSLLEVLRRWAELTPVLRAFDPAGAEGLDDAVLLAPLRYPGKVLCAGANYFSHVDEMGLARPRTPVTPYFFFKPPTTTVIGPGDAIGLPRRSERKIDWEAELGVVIGSRCRDVPATSAREVVAGWTVVNDVSARDRLQRPDPVAPPFEFDWVRAKAEDTFCPLGPGVVPDWLVGDPQDVRLRLSVNGAVKQDASTADMITSIAELVAAASALCTLEPGDVIATGTPAGVGHPRGEYLQPGDEVLVEIDGVGALRNPVVEIPTPQEKNR